MPNTFELAIKYEFNLIFSLISSFISYIMLYRASPYILELQQILSGVINQTPSTKLYKVINNAPAEDNFTLYILQYFPPVE